MKKVRYKKVSPTNIAYCGSLIQQNFGESLGKGYLLWDIESTTGYTVNHIPVKNDYGFFTIYSESEELPDLDLPKHVNLRLVWPIHEKDISRSVVNDLTARAHEKYSPSSVRIDFKPQKTEENANINIDNVTNFRLFSVQQDLLTQWLNASDHSGSTSDILKIDKQIYDLTHLSEADAEQTSLTWDINKIIINNFMSYERETIDLDKLSGIIGLFGENRAGKSVIIDAILYGLFNKTTRNVKNEDLINKRNNAKECSVELYLTIMGKKYRIIRRTHRIFKKRTKEYVWAKTTLELSEKLGDGWEDLSEDQRRTTEPVLRNIIGTYDDFLTIALSTQDVQSFAFNFITQKSSARADSMIKFLGLDSFSKKFIRAKELLRDIDSKRRGKSEAAQITKLSKQQETKKELKSKIGKIERRKASIKKDIQHARESIDNLKSTYNFKVSIDETEEDLLARKSKLTTEITELRNTIIASKSQISLKNLKLKKLTNNLLTNSEYEKARKVSAILVELEAEKQNKLSEISKYEALISHIVSDSKSSGCPLGPAGEEANCTYLLSHTNNQKLLAEYKTTITTLQIEVDDITNSLLAGDPMKAKLLKHDELTIYIGESKQQLQTLQYQLTSAKSALESKEVAITILDSKLDTLRANIEAVNKNRILDSEIKKLQAEIKTNEKLANEVDDILIEHKENLAVLNSEIKKTQSLIREIAKYDEKYRNYKIYCDAMHRDGITSNVLTQYIPIINYELSSILSQVVNFGIYFKMDDNKNIDIVMRSDTMDDTRSITMGSGMEKFISELSIRYVLLKLSCLNKPTTYMVDEGFGKLDDDSIFVVQKLFDIIREHFKNIIIITHMNSIKDCANHIITVSNANGISKLAIR